MRMRTAQALLSQQHATTPARHMAAAVQAMENSNDHDYVSEVWRSRGAFAAATCVPAAMCVRACTCKRNLPCALSLAPQKVFHALEAGCVPLYLGAPNAASFLPDAAAAIDVGAFVSLGELAAELGRLAADRAAYEERLAWKARAPDDWQPSALGWACRRQHALHNWHQRWWPYVCLSPVPAATSGFQQLIHLSEDSPKCRLCALLARHRAAPQRYTPCTANTSWQAEKAAALSTTDGPGGG